MLKQPIKSILFILFAALLYIALGFLGILPLPQSFKNLFRESPESISSTERIAKMIQDTYPTDLMIYGDDVLFEMQVPARKLEAITEDSLSIKDGCKYAFLVINDLANTVQLSDAENEMLKEELRKDGFCLFYLGEKYADVWRDPSGYTVSSPGNLSYQYYMKAGTLRRGIGAWEAGNEEYLNLNPYALGDTVLFEIEDFLRQIN